MSEPCPVCKKQMNSHRDNPKERGIESCANCKNHVEIIGITKPHPHRCQRDLERAHGLSQLSKEGWCMFYKSEDGAQRAMDTLVETCRWCGQ